MFGNYSIHIIIHSKSGYVLTNYKILRNGGGYILRNTGGNVLRNETVIISSTPSRSISHTTLDAGADLRHPKTRPQQLIRLTTEVGVYGAKTKHVKLKVKTSGTVRIFYEIISQVSGTAKTVSKYAIYTRGARTQKHVTSIPVYGSKGGKSKIIDILKQVLRDLE